MNHLLLKNFSVLSKEFYTRDTLLVAEELIGKVLIRKIDGKLLAGIIIETECYKGSDDPASHAYKGKNSRNFPMFGPVGFSYIYFIYGVHYCFNIAARSAQQEAGAVLIRAIEPVQGIAWMIKHRQKSDIYNLVNGPGKLTQALNIHKNHNNQDLTQETSDILVGSCLLIAPKTRATSRIGITQARDKMWRFMRINT